MNPTRALEVVHTLLGAGSPDRMLSQLAEICSGIVSVHRHESTMLVDFEILEHRAGYNSAIPERLAAEAIETARTVVDNNSSDALPAISKLCIPLVSRASVIGLLYLEAISDVTSETVFQLETICSVVATAFDLAITARRLEVVAEQSRFAEQEMRIASDMMSALTWRAAPDGTFEIGNRPWHEYTGLRLEDAQGHGYMRAFHPDDIGKVMTTWNRLVENGIPGEVEARMVRFDGAARTFLLRAVPLKNDAGQIIKWYGTNTDIEDLKIAKDELSRSQSILIEGERISRAGSWSWNAATDTITWSAQCARIFGFGEDSSPVTFEVLLQRVHPDDRFLVIEHHQNARHGSGDFSVEHRVLWPDGNVLLVESRGRLVRNSIGSIIEYAGTIRDITEWKAAQERIQETERRYAATLSSIGDAVIATDRNGGITFINPVAEKLTGWTHIEAVGQPVRGVFQIVNEEGGNMIADPVADVLKSDAGPVIESRILLRSREDREFLIDHSGAPIIDSQGEMTGAVLVFRDVTQRIETVEAMRKLREDLARMNRLTTIGELTVSIAHEMNQPLMAIVTNAAACLKWIEGAKPDLREAGLVIDRIIEDGHRAGQVLSSIRALAKNAPPSIRPLDVNDVIREVILLVRSDLRSQSVNVETFFAANHHAMGDRIQLQQVLLNLIMNGADAMSSTQSPRRIRIATRCEDPGYVQVDITDNGVGIDMADIDQIFEAFYTTKATGIGMGLSICRSIIDAHGGRLWATANPSGGSIFSFTVPRP